MIGSGFALMLDGPLTRDRESKFYAGTAPLQGSPPAIQTAGDRAAKNQAAAPEAPIATTTNALSAPVMSGPL